MTLSPQQDAIDRQFMARALQLAELGRYSTHPNPRVGCVIVSAGEVVGEGWHRRAGEPHAEVHALRQAGARAPGATAYVTLEPCSHVGRTPPCANALIDAGVARVVAAMRDPNPQVAGSGLARLAEAGIDVRVGVLEGDARALNPGFIKRMETGLPFVRLKLAMSLDGRTAMASGESQWITGLEARRAVQRLRAQASAVLTGADSVLADAARMTVRAAELGLEGEQAALALGRPPVRILIDGRLRVPLDVPFFQAGPSLVVCHQLPAQPAAYAQAGAELLAVPGNNGRVSLPELLRQLAARGIHELLVEAGAQLAGAFAQQRLVDEYQIFMAPCLLGSSARPLLDWPLARMADAPRLAITGLRAIGNDWLISAVPEQAV